MKISITVLFIFSLVLQCQAQVKVMSQLNEQRIVNLSKEFGIAISNYEVTSKSSFQIDQPLTSVQDEKFFGSPRTLTQSSLVIDSQTTQQLQLYFDFTLPKSQQDQRWISLVTIVKTSDQPQPTINEIAKLNLSEQFQGADLFEVALFQQNTAILLYTQKGRSYVCLVTLNGKNSFTFSTPVQLKGPSANLKCTYDFVTQNAFFMVQKVNTLTIQLRTMNLKGEVSDVLNETQFCPTISNPSVIYTPYTQGYLVQCVQGQQKFLYSFYYAELNKSQITQLSISDYINYQKTETIALNSINNVVYLVSKILDFPNQIRITQLTMNKAKFIITQTSRDIVVPINTSSLQYAHVSVNDLITLITNQVIVGVSVNQPKVLFQIQNDPIPKYNFFAVNLYGDQIAIQYQYDSANVFTTKFILTKVPQLTFTQVSNDMTFTLSYVNDSLKRQMTISGTQITSDSNTIIIKEPTANFQQNISYLSQVLNIDVEKYFIGYVKNGHVSDSFKNADLQSLESRFTFIEKEVPDRIYSTFSQNIIVQSQMNKNKEYTMTVSQPSLSNKIVNYYEKVTLTTPILSIDQQSGFFVNTNDKGERQIYIYYQKSSTEYSYSFLAINPSCEANKILLFSGDILNNQVAVLCGDAIKIFRFSETPKQFFVTSYNLNYDLTKLSTITQIQLQPSGLLYVTDNKTIIAIDINNNFQVGSVIIPNSQGVQTGEVIFFTDSFVFAKNENNTPSIQQYSYNNFDGTTATLIRSFLNFGYKFAGAGFQAIRDYNINSNEEFLIVDSVVDDQTVGKLFYRVSCDISIQAQNQLFTTINMLKTTPFIAIPSIVGYFQNQQYSFFELFYRITLASQIDVTPTTYNTQISYITNGKLTLNDKYVIDLNLSCYRSVAASKSVIMYDDEDIVNIKNYFNDNQITTPLNYPFEDRKATNGHLFGWELKDSDETFIFKMSFTQRLVTQYNQINSKILRWSYNQLMVMPNAMIVSNDEGIFVEGQLVTNTSYNDCQFYKEDKYQDISKVGGKTVVKQVVYTISKDYTQSKTISLIQTSIQGTYDLYPTSQPAIEIESTTTYTLDDTILQNNTILTMITDKNLGLLALIQENGNSSTQVCQISIAQGKSTFTFDCNIYSSISRLLITNIIYIKSADLNIFVSTNEQIYYGFSQDLSQYSMINIKNLLYEKGLQVFDSPMILAQQLQESSILISYYQANSFILTFSFNNNVLTVNDTIQTLFAQPGLQLVGGVYINAQNQIFLLHNVNFSSTNFIFCMYEPYNGSNSQYLIRTSQEFIIQSELKNAMITMYNGQLLLGRINYRSAVMKPMTFDVFDKPVMNITQLQYNKRVTTDSSTLPFKFFIRPLQQSTYLLPLSTPVLVNQNGSSSVSASSRMKFSLLLLMVIQQFN